MLRELLEYRFTPDGLFGRDFDHRAQTVALGARHRRQRAAWKPHIDRCHAFISQTMAMAPGGGTALVVGSGRLVEVPLDDLADHFGRVTLLDVVHPLVTRRAAKRRANVILRTADVTGALALTRSALTSKKSLPDPMAVETPLRGERFDYVISANVISQLPIFPTSALEERRPDIDESARTAFAQGLVRRHFDWLRGVGDVAAAFSDVEDVWVDATGATVSRGSTLWGVTPPPPDQTWDWAIAPRPEEDRHLDLRHTVAAWRNLNSPP